ncbi:MAG: hypothetical protein H0S84_10735 [Bacteroidales bacterium]|jgi:hypothetical protein|nr:hypothetical protein [Bacteroidales bacterium]MDN5351016.1 hypothetical protein [Bacteroidales bacterium]
MKKINLIMSVFLTLAILMSGSALIAQSSKELKKEVKSKALKDARKEAKRLDKEGYKVNPGQLPMDKQLEKSWMMAYEFDDKGQKKYFLADGTSVGETQSAAKLQAYEVAKINLAGQIETEIAGLVTTNLGNQQLSADEAASVTQTMGQFKSKLNQQMGRTLTAFEAYKPVGKNTEVRVTIAYSTEEAMKIAKNIIREDLKKTSGMDDQKISKVLEF